MKEKKEMKGYPVSELQLSDTYLDCISEKNDVSLPVERIIDAHCHIYPDGIAPKAIRAIDRFYGGLPFEPLDGTEATLLREGRKDGVTAYVVHSVATAPTQTGHINEYIWRCVSQSDGAFIGLGTLFPGSENTDKDFEHILRLRLKGVKLHPDIQQFYADDPWVMHVYELCEEAGVPICLHTGDYRFDYSNPNRIFTVLKTFPKLKLIGAHFGGWSVWEEAVRKLADFPNLRVDTSSSFFALSPEKAKELIHAYGSERIMFGSDYPMWRRGPEFEYLRRLDLDAQEYEDIFHGTCEKLFERIPGSRSDSIAITQ